MNNGVRSIVIGVSCMLLLSVVSGMHMPPFLFIFLFIVCPIVGFVFGMRAKKGVYTFIGSFLNGVIVIYASLIILAM